MVPTSRSALRVGATLLALLTAACADPTATPSPMVAGAVAPPVASKVAQPDPNRHILDLSGGIPVNLAATVAAHGGRLVRVDTAIQMAVTSGLSDADAAAIAGRSNVVHDYTARWVPTLQEVNGTAMADTFAAPAPQVTPKSPLTAYFYDAGLQWDMQQIHADAAWAEGRSGIPTVRVAILDTGLDPDHQDENGTVIDQASSTFFTPSLSPDPGPRWIDDHFHGTHVGGTVTTNNIGTAGVAPNVTLVAVKVLNAAGSGSFADIISGIYYATNVHVQVINMSIGAYFQKGGRDAAQLIRMLTRAINYAHAHDVLVVSAAGNDNTDLQHDQNYIELPCEVGVQLCVSATGITDTKASYSNYGSNSVNVAAPGGDVDAFVIAPCTSHSINPALAACRARNFYLSAAGTSMAAPHVSGLGAYLDSQFGGMLTASQMITSIEQHADDLGKPGDDPIYGHGRIDVLATVNDPTP